MDETTKLYAEVFQKIQFIVPRASEKWWQVFCLISATSSIHSLAHGRGDPDELLAEIRKKLDEVGGSN